MPRTALLLGATGLVGGHVLDRLIEAGAWDRVVTLGRRPMPTVGECHGHHVVDFDALESREAGAANERGLFTCDDYFCCLGTTIKTAGSQAAFRRVDHGIPIEAARLALEGGATQALLVSALGADPSSRVFYNRVKGETERDLGAAGFESVVITRPSLLSGDRDEDRLGERVGLAVLGAIEPLMIG
ncbi:oxidoreductase, partial [Rubrivirga sp.]|uniref:oxidoreductase n=1 Tax=Rubrivirga sp. TaxID=1885344 RepID=UPI003C753F04